MRKYCYGCVAEDGYCLVGEKQITILNRFGNLMHLPSRKGCCIRSKKDFVKRLEEQLERMKR